MKHLTLEQKLLSLLEEEHKIPGLTYRLTFYSLQHDGSWDDAWTAAREATLEDALEMMRGRWEVWKFNYCKRARVNSLEDIGFDQYYKFTAESMAFADLEVNLPN